MRTAPGEVIPATAVEPMGKVGNAGGSSEVGDGA
jgi:hypothetical protein